MEVEPAKWFLAVISILSNLYKGNLAMRLILTASLVMALAACASNEAPVAAAAAPAAAPSASGAVVAQQTCHRETKTGTNMYQTVCEPTSDGDRQGSIDGIHKMVGTGSMAAGNGFSHN
jgi:hypothetical protein